MSFFVLRRLVSLHLLFQFAIFLAEPSQSYSVTYHPSAEKCKGDELESKCKGTGQALAKISDTASLEKVKGFISDGEKYWIGLWYMAKGNHGVSRYCWEENFDHSSCDSSSSSVQSFVDISFEASREKNEWYCFWVEKNGAKLKAQKCSDGPEHKYICQADSPTSELSSMHANSASMKPVTIATPALMSTATGVNIVTTSSLPKPTTQIITTQVTPSTVITTSVNTTPLLTDTLTSNLRTTEVISVKQTLITGGSSLTVTTNNDTSTQEKLSAKKQLHKYVSVISALDVSEVASLQDAANTTNSLFKSLKENDNQNKDVNVLQATKELERFAISYGKIHIEENESKIVSKELFAMKIQKVPADQKTPIFFSIDETDHSSKESSAGISLPPKIFKGQDTMVISIVYNDIKQWAPDPKDVELDGTKFNRLEIGSRIIATTIDPKPNGTLEENVTISFTQDKEVNKGKTPHCVFWDFTIKSDLNGSWASTGCSMIQQVDGKITCSCNHLTNFAVLMQVGEGNVGKQISSDHKKALEIITYIGCGLSLAGELLTVIAYFALMNVKQEQLQIRLNLVVAIAIAQIVFLSGIDASESKGACVFVAAMIHYFYLVGFAWMLFEGVYLYLMVVKVFNTVIRMRLFYAFAWGFPLVMVVLSLIIASSQDGGVNNYVHGDFCWVSFKNNLIWTFAAPVLVVCVINATILARVLYEIMRMQSDKTSELEKIRQGLKALAVLFPLLGLTWLFGLLAVTDAGLAFQYIFTILNSLQGFFIFVIHILKNSDVRAAFARKKQKWTDSRNISSSRVTSHATDMWPSKVTSEHSQDSQAELSPRKSHKPRASASGYENMNMVPQERNLTPVQM